MVAESKNEFDTLFREYLDVCNRALEANKDKFPYKQLWSMTESVLDDSSVKFAVYDDRPKECYSLKLEDHKIKPVKKCDTEDAKEAWRMNLSYLQRVVEHPEEYIEHPAKLDWEWLKSRLGS